MDSESNSSFVICNVSLVIVFSTGTLLTPELKNFSGVLAQHIDFYYYDILL